MKEIENPLESLHDCMVFAPNDWGNSGKRLAWMYGIIVGWDGDGVCEPADAAMQEVQKQYRWSDEEVARLRRLHEKYLELHAQVDKEIL